jgi:hypothetical protein
MAVLKLRNGITAVTLPQAIVVDVPDGTKYHGRDASFIKGQELVFDVKPWEVDDYMNWKGGDDGGHGPEFDVVKVLSDQEAEEYFAKFKQ